MNKDNQIQKIIDQYHVNPLVASAIVFNNCDDDKIHQLFMEKVFTDNNDESLIKVCNRLIEAKKNNEKVFIGGDYDCDGICATAILKATLDAMGIENGYYIPNRFLEGYGLSAKTVEMVYKKGYNIIITVDNGVKAYEAIDKAKELGIEIIITDHHIIEKDLEVPYFTHPHIMGGQYQYLSGAGVAFEISRKLIGLDDYLLVLAMVATIGDVMELWGANRTIVTKGIEVLNKMRYPNIVRLLNTNNSITSKDIAFQLVPKINAIGRLDDDSNPNNLVMYLLSKKLSEVNMVADQINALNQKRKTISNDMYLDAINEIKDEKIIVVQNDDFSEGLIGLVASRIANEYKKPTIVMTEVDNTYKASCRSLVGFDLYEFFNEGFEDIFNTFGGHSKACAFSIKAKDYDELISRINKKVDANPFEIIEKDVTIEIDAKDITISNVQEYLKLAPFGQGFEEPLFAIKSLKTLEYTLIKDKYPKFIFNNQISGISFTMSPNEVKDEYNQVIANVGINSFRGKDSVQLSIKSIE